MSGSLHRGAQFSKQRIGGIDANQTEPRVLEVEGHVGRCRDGRREQMEVDPARVFGRATGKASKERADERQRMQK